MHEGHTSHVVVHTQTWGKKFWIITCGCVIVACECVIIACDEMMQSSVMKWVVRKFEGNMNMFYAGLRET